MKLQTLLFWGRLLLLTTSPGPGTVSADFYCADRNTTDYIQSSVNCDSPNYCAIDRVTGKIQGCVATDQCPDQGGTDKILACDPSKPNCCYRSLDKTETAQCNNMASNNDDRPWKRACSMAEFKNLPFCKVNPTSVVWCKIDKPLLSENCGPSRFCAIDKSSASAILGKCKQEHECPAGAGAVCEPGKPYCCCQIHTPKGVDPVRPLCNDFRNDYAIWKQACGLKELSHLNECHWDPPSTTTTSKPTEEPPTVTTESSETPSQGPKEVTESLEGEDLGDKEADETDVSTAAMVIGGIIVWLIIGGLIYVCCFKKRPHEVGTSSSYQQQQQQWVPLQVSQQPMGPAQG